MSRGLDRARTASPRSGSTPTFSVLVRALAVGVLFGFVLVKSEAASWYRIQEMFRFQDFHMYGILGSAVLTGLVSTRLLRRVGLRALDGAPIDIARKESHGLNVRYWAGGAIFGLGWGLLGACPGPIYALVGAGHGAFIVALLSALAGTWAYASVRPWLPH